MKTAIVTGAAGFLGSHLCERLVNEGFTVVGVDNFSTGLTSNISYLEEKFNAEQMPLAAGGSSNHYFEKQFYFVNADVSLPWTWWNSLPQNLQSSLKLILHFASPASPPHYQRLNLETVWVNTIGLQNALELARPKEDVKVVFASTSEVYGDPEVHPQIESYWGNVNPYGERSCYDEPKRMGETLIYIENKNHQKQHGLVRIFNTYGPRMNPDDGRVVINFLVQAHMNRPLTIYGDGLQTRSFCYVSDLVEAIFRYSQSTITQPVNIGNDKEYTILELAQKVVSMFPDRKLVMEHKALPKDDPKQRRPNLDLSKKLLNNWQANVTVDEGLLHLYRWLRMQNLDSLFK